MPLDLDDLGEHLNMPHLPGEDDPRRGELQRALDTAVGEVIRMTGWIDDATVTLSVSPGWSTLLALPVVRLTAVGPVRDPAGALVLPYRVDLLAGLVEVSLPAYGTWTVQVTGSPWPAALQTAALDWAAHVYDTQRTTLNPAADDDVPLPGFALPRRVSEFLTPYLLPGIA